MLPSVAVAAARYVPGWMLLLAPIVMTYPLPSAICRPAVKERCFALPLLNSLSENWSETLPNWFPESLSVSCAEPPLATWTELPPREMENGGTYEPLTYPTNPPAAANHAPLGARPMVTMLTPLVGSVRRQIVQG